MDCCELHKETWLSSKWSNLHQFGKNIFRQKFN